MAKTKLLKYERVQELSNVTFSQFGEFQSPGEYPWYAQEFEGMEKVLELGCGKGEHCIGFAAKNSQGLYLGIDSKSHRICVGAEQAIEQGLNNVHFLRVRIERICAFFIRHSIHEIWLTFPDPHLKKRSIKNRLSAPLFLDAYARLLVPGGVVHLKTDSESLYTYTRESVESWGGQVIAAVDDLHRSEPDGSDFHGFGLNGSEPYLGETCLKKNWRPGARDIVSSFEKAALSRGASIKYMAFTLG